MKRMLIKKYYLLHLIKPISTQNRQVRHLSTQELINIQLLIFREYPINL